jgi:hypothetical protein
MALPKHDSSQDLPVQSLRGPEATIVNFMKLSIRTIASIAVLGAAISANAATLASFVSGTGTVTALAGPASGEFAPLTAGDFAGATSGVSVANAGGWVDPSSAAWTSNGGDSSATWVSVGNTSGLYKIDFTTASDAVNASFMITYSVDDQLGGINNEGIFFDGAALAGTSTGILWNGGVEQKTFSLGNLSAGTHSIYLNVTNSGGGPSGAIFNGTVSGEAVPEPATMAVLGLGVAAMLRRKKKA